MTYVMCLRKPSLHETSWENPLREPHHWRKDGYYHIVPMLSSRYPRIIAYYDVFAYKIRKNCGSFGPNSHINQYRGNGMGILILTPNRANRESQKNPPKRAMSGRSMRQQAFMAFELGMRPTEVARMIKLSRATAFRYFQQWKNLPPFLETKYRLARRCFRKLNDNERRKIAKVLAHELGTSEEEVSASSKRP